VLSHSVTSMPARSPSREEPLLLASWMGDHREVLRLLARGHDVNTRTRERSTPLHFAVGRGHLELAHELLKARADVHATDQAGRSPLHEACTSRPQHESASSGQLGVIRLLLTFGARARQPDLLKRSAFELAQEQGVAKADAWRAVGREQSESPVLRLLDLAQHEKGMTVLRDELASDFAAAAAARAASGLQDAQARRMQIEHSEAESRAAQNASAALQDALGKGDVDAAQRLLAARRGALLSGTAHSDQRSVEDGIGSSQS
jgi:ankyrin repeat protein